MIKADRRTFLGAAAALLPLAVDAQPLQAGRPPAELARHALSGPFEGYEAVLVELNVAPGSLAPGAGHRHPGAVLGYVLEGQLRFGVDRQPEKVIAAGGTFFEPSGAVHTTHGSATTTGATRAVVFHAGAEGERARDARVMTPTPAVVVAKPGQSWMARLFCGERRLRIDLSRPKRRPKAPEAACEQEDAEHRREDERIKRCDLEQAFSKTPGHGHCREQAKRQSKDDRRHASPQYRPMIAPRPPPIAIRSPISRVRCVTQKAMIP